MNKRGICETKKAEANTPSEDSYSNARTRGLQTLRSAPLSPDRAWHSAVFRSPGLTFRRWNCQSLCEGSLRVSAPPTVSPAVRTGPCQQHGSLRNGGGASHSSTLRVGKSVWNAARPIRQMLLPLSAVLSGRNP